jgi:hypothetical protein
LYCGLGSGFCGFGLGFGKKVTDPAFDEEALPPRFHEVVMQKHDPEDGEQRLHWGL